jgi:hypothetical protein
MSGESKVGGDSVERLLRRTLSFGGNNHMQAELRRGEPKAELASLYGRRKTVRRLIQALERYEHATTCGRQGLMRRPALKTLGCGALLALLICGAPAAANADTITTNLTFGPSAANSSLTLSVAQFDPSLGTLNSVTVSDLITAWASGTIVNDQFVELVGRVAFHIDSFLDTPAGADQLYSTSYALQMFDLLPGQNATFSPNLPQRGIGSVTYNSDLTSYIGTGDVSFTGHMADSYALLGVAGSVAATTQQDVSIRYDYTPNPDPDNAPEPLSLLLLGSGLVGMGVLRHKRLAS